MVNEIKSTIITQSNLFSSPGKIKKIIKKRLKKKKPGNVSITNTTLKLLKNYFLMKVINSCLKTCYFPNNFEKRN